MPPLPPSAGGGLVGRGSFLRRPLVEAPRAAGTPGIAMPSRHRIFPDLDRHALARRCLGTAPARATGSHQRMMPVASRMQIWLSCCETSRPAWLVMVTLLGCHSSEGATDV